MVYLITHLWDPHNKKHHRHMTWLDKPNPKLKIEGFTISIKRNASLKNWVNDRECDNSVWFVPHYIVPH